MKKSFVSSQNVATTDKYSVKRRALFCCLIGTAVLFLCGQSLPAATFNNADGDVTGLKNAITTSNSNAQDDTIELAASGTYTLTVRDNGINGLPQIGPDGTHTLTIHGNGATIQRSSAPGALTFRIFFIQSGANATLSGLTLTNGNPGTGSGAAIYNDRATLTITNCTITANGNTGSHGGAN